MKNIMLKLANLNSLSNKPLALAFTTAALALMSIATSTSEAQAGLINGGFEIPDISSEAEFSQLSPELVPGWETTDVSIEIWANGFRGVFAQEGTQFAEINAFINGTLYQDVTGIAAGSEVGFTFLHRARVGTDVMGLTITDLGIDNLFGTSDDTVLFTKNYSATTAAWVNNTNAGEDPIFTVGNNVRFAYSAVSTGSGNPSIGNFLDAADFGVGVGPSVKNVPEPASTLGLLAIGALGATSAFKRKNNQN